MAEYWEKVCDQLNSQYIYSLCVFNARLYGGTYGVAGVRLFRLNGAENAWEQICASYGQGSVRCMIVYNDKLYAGTGEGFTSGGGELLKLNDAGDGWDSVCAQLDSQKTISSLCVHDGRLYGSTTVSVGSGAKLFRLNVGENAWEEICDTLDGERSSYSLTVYDGRLYAGVNFPGNYGKLYRLNATGDAWEEVCRIDVSSEPIVSLVVYNDRLYGGTAGGGRLLRLNEDGDELEEICAQYDSQGISNILVYYNRIFATTLLGKLLRVNAAGNAWEEVCDTLDSQRISQGMALYEDRIWAGTSTDGYLFVAVVTPPAVAAAFTANVWEGTTPITVNFTDQSTGSPTSWLWYFGDGSSSTEQNPTHYFPYGTYQVILTASNDTSSDSVSHYISVNPLMSSITINGTLLLDGDIACNGDIEVTTSGKVIPVPDPDLMKTFYSYQTNSYITANGGSSKITSTTGNIVINGVIDGEGAGFESNRGPGCNSLLTDSGNPLGGYGATHAGLGCISG